MRARTQDLRIASPDTLRHAYERRLRELKFKRWQHEAKLNPKGLRLLDRCIFSTIVALRELNR